MTAATRHAVHRVGRDHCLAPSRTVDAPAGGARYGRMFPDLPSLIADGPALEAAGQPGGVCDAAAALDMLTRGGDDAVGAAGLAVLRAADRARHNRRPPRSGRTPTWPRCATPAHRS
jgi:hypothetical protein